MTTPLIIFDCDGVLVDSEPLAAIAYERVYNKHGLALKREIVGQCIGMKQADIITRIEELTGFAFPAHADGDIWLETKALLEEELQPTRGIVPFLSNLKTARCVASSSSMERIELSLGVSGIAGFFGDDVFSTSMVKNGKPAPDIFLFAAEKLGGAPASSVVIEDSPFGVQGAVAAGMTAIGFTGGSHTFDGHGEKLSGAGAHAVCASWDEIEAELRQRGFIADAVAGA
ncbi:HAD family phosphatase [Nitratireductor aquimarinus]|uniref:HAD family hydrolase n=1 Tax=Nitratireductor TaxID=245876 RepID=UPI0019D40251|nr:MULTISPECIES: HAD family phosphatase [Nitratireductor]MBN7777285.1 HAD family phosphatase [Nitratireductor pacificus]MBN7780956.1 HAD family phosphatase [Nitratireductor pacificus]MBN7789762.1 HAD family phosphatase [Nitratireductor aquimarinus]MBY6099494.1 HAD family phosphatase [Nitratireductor aquimarinus]MCA1260214.1 HAD family phosphatase [Nitratireductor aquimarinus]